MSLLFIHTCYLLRVSPLPAISHVGSRLPLSHTFHEHLFVARPSDSLLPSDATRTAFEPFLWCHPRKQNGHTRHLVATKVGAVVFATRGRKRRGMWVENGVKRSRLPHVPEPTNATSQSDLRTSCRAAHSVRRVGSAGRQSPLNPNAHGCRSSDRAGLCCVHRLGCGRGGRREDE